MEECDFCKAPAEYDGKTRFGPWAYMCEKCFREYGSGLGVGRGQHLHGDPVYGKAGKPKGKFMVIESPKRKE